MNRQQLRRARILERIKESQKTELERRQRALEKIREIRARLVSHS